MTRVAGVKTETDNKGRLASVTINVKKHPQAVDLLKEAGLLEKSQFEIECESAITIEEARTHTQDFINNLPWKK